jgi:hypothetical protein
MGELGNIEINAGDEIRKAKKAPPVGAQQPTEAALEVVYDAATLVKGAKAWFGASRPRVASVLKHGKIESATRSQVKDLLKGK